MTKEDLEKNPRTLMKFFLLQGKAELSMFNDAMIFYKTFSRNKISRKRFTENFLENVKIFNSTK
jgi:hypothetical protein